MTPYQLRKNLLAGEFLFGTLIVSASPRWPDAIRSCGLDFVFIDTEHIAIDREKLSWMCQTYSAMGLPPLVRIPSPDPYYAAMVLDGGAAGVIAPYVETVEQVRALSGAVKMRPIKGRRLKEMLDGGKVETSLQSYIGNGASNRVLMVNIESVPAIEALDEIVGVAGLDGVLIGPHDLSCSLGQPENYAHADFLAACETICGKARDAGIGAGIHFPGTPEQQARFLDLGVNLLIHSSDIRLFQTYLHRELDEVKRMAGRREPNGLQPATINI